MFADKETAAAVVEHVDANPLELDGRQLIVRHYVEPPHHVPKGMFHSLGFDLVIFLTASVFGNYPVN